MLLVWGCTWDKDAFGMEIFIVWGCSWFGDAHGFGMLMVSGCSWDEDALGMLLVWGCSRDEDSPTAITGWECPYSDAALGCSRSQQVPVGTLPGQGCSFCRVPPGMGGIHPQVGDASRSVRIHGAQHHRGHHPAAARPQRAAITIGQGGRAGGDPAVTTSPGQGGLQAPLGVFWGGCIIPAGFPGVLGRVTAPSLCRGG